MTLSPKYFLGRCLMIRISLSPEQKNELEKFRHQASSKDSEKALMILLSAEGQSVSTISTILKRNPHTVRDWLKRYRKNGLVGLSRKYSPGRPDDKRNKVKEQIERIIHRPPSEYGYMDSVWTVSLIAHDVEKELIISISTDTVIRALKNLGYSYKRPSKTLPPAAPSRKEKIAVIEKIIEDVQTITSEKQSVIYALDESHFSTEPYLVQGWFKKRWPPWNTNFPQKGKSHILWLLEFGNTKILLEKITPGKQ
jgi:transposase